MSEIKTPVSILGHSQCTEYHDSEQVLFVTFDYVESSVSLISCESQTRPKCWDGGSNRMSFES